MRHSHAPCSATSVIWKTALALGALPALSTACGSLDPASSAASDPAPALAIAELAGALTSADAVGVLQVTPVASARPVARCGGVFARALSH